MHTTVPLSKIGERHLPESNGLHHLLNKTEDTSYSWNIEVVYLWKSPILENIMENLRAQFAFRITLEMPAESTGCGVLNAREVES